MTEKVWLVWKGCKRKPLLSKKNMAAQLLFAKLHLNKPQDFWNNVLWTDQTKVEMFGHNAQQHVWRNQTQHISTNNLVLESVLFRIVLQPKDIGPHARTVRTNRFVLKSCV